MLPDFSINSDHYVSIAFREHNIDTFRAAIHFIQNLPYGRNANKDDLITIFLDQCATCSTKHAILKKLAEENNFSGLELTLGIYKMNGQNTPKTARTLSKQGLNYIPEAHIYLKYAKRRFDFTHRNSTAAGFENDLLSEQQIDVAQINLPKIAIHKAFLQQWLNDNPDIAFTLDELWRIREQCIQDLSD